MNRLLLKIFFKRVKIILLGKELYPEKAPFISEKNVFYCPNGMQSVAEIQVESTNKKELTHFLFLSNMMVEKGVFVLLDACKILKEKQFEFKCDFVGGWKDISEKEFEQKVLDFNLQNEVKYHGPQYGTEKKNFFEQADVFVFPTYYHGECFPLVLLEAMDYALPCLSTKNGAIPSLIEKGKTGFCILQKNVGVLSEKMIWMIEHPNERREMGQSGKKRFEENFRLQKFEENFVSILNECV